MKRNLFRYLLVLILGISVTVLTGCSSGGDGPSETPMTATGTVNPIVLSATPGNLQADGLSTATITATVTDVNVANGEAIAFSVPLGCGTLSAATAQTAGGIATVIYTAPTSVPQGGSAVITAESADGQMHGTVAIVFTGGTQIAGITLSADPVSLPADGSSTSTITANVTAVGGGEAPDNTIVIFSIITPGDASVVGSISPEASTAGGDALAILTSGSTSRTVTIRAEAGGRTAELDVEYTPGSMEISIIPNSLLGTGEETAAVTATVKTAAGDAVSDAIVSFALAPLGLGTLSSDSATTDSEGEANVTFQAAAKGGTVTVTATWTELDITGSEPVDIQPRPAFIEIADGSPDPASIDVKGTGGQSTSLITFDVKDSQGNYVTNGYRIDFYIDSSPNGGEDILPISALTTDGQVSTILRSGFKSGPVGIKAVYHHDTNISTTTCQVAINAGPPVGEEFGISAEYVNISGFWMTNLEDVVCVNAGDIYGNAIPDDTSISFKTYNTGGFFEPGSAATLNGLASNNLHSSGTYTQPLEGFVSVTAETNNGGRTTHVTCLAVTPESDNNIIYAGTDGGGVYKSTDSGATWTNISRSSTIQGQNWIDPYVNDIDVDPDDPNAVYAATGYLGRGNVYRSLDGGNTWNSDNTEEWKGVLSTGAVVLTVLCDDSSSDYVWVGTEGLGAIYAVDGESFQWGGLLTHPVLTGTGNGTMSSPTLSATSRTEEWTATYVIPSASATVPEPGSSNAGNGAMSNVTTDQSATLTEIWTATYAVGIGDVVPGSNTGTGVLYGISLTRPNEPLETWTLTCVDNATLGEEIFSVETSTAGIYYPDATVGTQYDTNRLAFTISAGATGFAEGDRFTFYTEAYWQVSGSVSGAQSNTAGTDILYTSDFDEIAFTISEGGSAFEEGDFFTFTTTRAAPPYWNIYGTVSGTQARKAYNGSTYTSDNDEVTFVISEGSTPFVQGDHFTYNVTESGLGHGKVVNKIVKVPGTMGDSAVLYAGTRTGVFRSDNGGRIWAEPELDPKSFTGDYITCLAVHPTYSNVIYAGTEAAGVWVSVDSGQTWTAWNSGTGKGLSATLPVADPANKGNGAMSAVTVDDNTLSECWTVRCTAAAADGGTFSVTGSVSGDQPDATVGTAYTSNNSMVFFTISDGTSDFEINDSFQFTTTRDPAGTIKDLLVDDGNDRLYAITYFWGTLEPHAVGNLYVHGLNADGSMTAGAWEEANIGLPEFDPPDDTTLFAQHVMAPDIAGTPNALYIGGEGINLYKATTGLTSGSPAWNESKTGLTNLVMARMPILFSGECDMTITEDRVGDIVTYTVYIEDVNGNPPISGSTFEVIKTHTTNVTLLEVTYADCYTHPGTWRDPSDPGTNNPYIIRTSVAREDPLLELRVEFTFIPTCGDSAPGCSGCDQRVTYLY